MTADDVARRGLQDVLTYALETAEQSAADDTGDLELLLAERDAWQDAALRLGDALNLTTDLTDRPNLEA